MSSPWWPSGAARSQARWRPRWEGPLGQGGRATLDLPLPSSSSSWAWSSDECDGNLEVAGRMRGLRGKSSVSTTCSFLFPHRNLPWWLPVIFVLTYITRSDLFSIFRSHLVSGDGVGRISRIYLKLIWLKPLFPNKVSFLEASLGFESWKPRGRMPFYNVMGSSTQHFGDLSTNILYGEIFQGPVFLMFIQMVFSLQYLWRALQPTPVFLPGESRGQRSLVGQSPHSHKESKTTEATEHFVLWDLG